MNLFTLSDCACNCDVAKKIGTIDFNGTAPIKRPQTSKETVVVTIADAQCE